MGVVVVMVGVVMRIRMMRMGVGQGLRGILLFLFPLLFLTFTLTCRWW